MSSSFVVSWKLFKLRFGGRWEQEHLYSVVCDCKTSHDSSILQLSLCNGTLLSPSIKPISFLLTSEWLL